MSFEYIGKAINYTSGGATTLDTLTTLDIAEGDLLVVAVRWYNGDGDVTVAEDDDSNPFEMGVRDPNGGGGWLVMGYLLDAAASAGATIRATFGVSSQYRCMIIFQFRPVAGKVVSKDGGESQAGPTTDNNPTSGLISTTGDDQVVVCITNTNNWGYTVVADSQEIGALAAQELTQCYPAPSNVMLAGYYQFFNEPKTDIFGEDTRTGSNLWIANILGFKATASGAETHYLVGSADSVSLLSGEFDIELLLEGSADSVSLLSGTIDLTKDIIGSLNSVSLLSGILNVNRPLIGSLNSVSLLSGDLSCTLDLSGIANSVSLLSGDLSISIDLSGSSDSMSLFSGNVNVTVLFQGIINSVSLLSGLMSLGEGEGVATKLHVFEKLMIFSPFILGGKRN